MVGSCARHELFDRARRRAGWSIQDLWLHTLALGGTVSVFDVEAFLYGALDLPPMQQDMLANALNDCLFDLYRAAKVPLLDALVHAQVPAEDPLVVLEELLGAARQPPPRDAPDAPDARD